MTTESFVGVAVLERITCCHVKFGVEPLVVLVNTNPVEPGALVGSVYVIFGAPCPVFTKVLVALPLSTQRADAQSAPAPLIVTVEFETDRPEVPFHKTIALSVTGVL